jgi:hypothetical protein
MELFNSRLAYDKEVGNEKDRPEHEAADVAKGHAAERRPGATACTRRS